MLSAAIIVAGYVNREQLAIKIKSVYAPVAPKPAAPSKTRPRAAGRFSGDAPWALSALPECFTQENRVTGPRAFVLAHMPAGATEVKPGVRVAAGDCVAFVNGGAVWVWRGADRLRVPPPARLYETGSTLALLQGKANAYDLRVYQTAPLAAAPAAR